MDGELVRIDKPKGISSFDVIRILRRELNIKKMGHAGTLDPLASGLLIIGVGAGTKKLAELVGLDKTYEVDALLGQRTSTGDMEGEILERNESKVRSVTIDDVRNIAEGMVGALELPVPAYSAIKQGGEALYKKARRGEKVVVPKKTMIIHSLELIEVQPLTIGVVIRMVMDVSSGTYVRSVVEEFGKRLGVPATTKELRRTRVGEFRVEGARSVDASKLT
jgi:tRNA pseudouridine55 synthase